MLPVNGQPISARNGEQMVAIVWTERSALGEHQQKLGLPVDNLRRILLSQLRKPPPFFPEPSSAFPHRGPSKTGTGQGF
jgi:hypothetical protein